ncbi:histidine kinase [Chitinimonas arctica]|uniref:Histidine kinase n=1 Tax=Chitinimonas arctica TaxID=2594795 RepID=A0A516SDI1_9NEIS|nr:histidine kinase [Chitinimonas arctica]QDQ26212.1 histidine kinase [Chitinimonas arctica]
MTPAEYLALAGLDAVIDHELVTTRLKALEALAATVSIPADPTTLYRYRVPELGENGACSLPDQLAEAPYDLAATLGGVREETSANLARLQGVVDRLVADSACGWLGVYQTRELPSGPALVKLAYRGKPSRAEFPLTADFARHSNNSTVGLSGRGKLIAHVDSYVAEGGAYYTCDAEVQSEACLPLFDQAGTVVGIIDAEDARRDFFQGEVLASLVALCLLAPTHLPR